MLGLLKTLDSIRRNETSPDDLVSILKNAGVALPQDVIEAALKNVAPREDGTLDLEEFLKHLIKSQLSSASESEKIDTSPVDEVSNNMDIGLTDELEQILFEHLPAPDGGSVDMETLVGDMKMLKEKIDIANLNTFLDDMGIELSSEEYDDLISHLPVSADRKISQLNLMNTIKNLKRGKVDTTKLVNALEKIGVELTHKEFQDLQEHLPVDTDGKVALNALLDKVDLLKKEEGKLDVSDLDNILEKMGIGFSEKPSESCQVHLSIPLGEVPHISVQLSKPLGEVPHVSAQLSKPLGEVPHVSGEKIDIRDLDTMLQKMDIDLTKEKVEELKRSLPVDAQGKTDFDSLVNILQVASGMQVDVRDLDSLLGNMAFKLTPEKSTSKSPVYGRDDGVNMKKISKHKEIEPKIQKSSEWVNDPLIEGGKIDMRSLDNILGKMKTELSKKEFKRSTDSLKAKEKTDVSELVDMIKAEKEGEPIGVTQIRSILHLRDLSRESMDLTNNSVDDIREFYQKKLADSVEAIEGDDTDVSKLESVLQNLDMKLTENQMRDLKENLQVDDNGKTSFRNLLDTVTSVVAKDLGIEDVESVPEDVELEHRDQDKLQRMKSQLVDEWIPDSKSMDTLIQSVGVNLAEQEINNLLQNLPVGVQGEVETDTFVGKAKSFTGKKIHSNDMKKVLEDMGIDVTDKDLKSLQNLLPFDGGEVKLDNVDAVLKNLGVKLTPKEQKRLMENLPSHDESFNGKIPFNQLIDAVTKVTGGEVNVEDIKNTLEKMGLELSDEEFSQVESKLPVNANGKVYLNRLLEGVLASKNRNVDVANVDTILQNMGMDLTEMEKEDLIGKLPVDDNEKVELRKLLNLLKAYTVEGDFCSVLLEVEDEVVEMRFS
ncbi:uncharacterized protein LOC101834266 [Mesocricetus auratus]|uniref:Uncharacterized protein LOC101834266 n=1 Tax=Mesocricetus auratus TaxID=10036 RepID=A0ABM2XSA5_MESAU|nr:uncharacterized protein LOC101834266 [Mesocricetus auratus]